MTKPVDLAALLAGVARTQAVPPSALLAMVAAFVKAPVTQSADALERLFVRKAGDFLALRARLSQPVDDADLAHLRRAAGEALEAGRFADADKTLAQGEQRILGQLSGLGELPLDRRLLAGETRADRAATSLLELTPQACREAAKRCGEAAAIIGLADPGRSHALALSQADALMRIGEDFADAEGYEAAIAQLRALLGGLDNFDDTVPWAGAQERLGAALEGLASLGGKTAAATAALLKQAAACYRTALEDLRKPQDPALWRLLQRRLGGLALALGEQAGDEALIEEAVDAYRAALMATDEATEPEDWARRQFDLGRALSVLGKRTGGMAQLETAFNALQASTKVWTRESAPALWSDVQDRMGQVLRAMGERYSESVVLEEAVAAFGQALEERSRETAPLLWATTSANQGLAVMELARRQKHAGLAQQALAQIVAAVEAMRAAGFAANAAELQKKMIEAGALAEQLRKR